MTAPKFVVPDQREIWCTSRQESWGRKETSDIICAAQIVTHQEIWFKKTVPKH